MSRACRACGLAALAVVLAVPAAGEEDLGPAFTIQIDNDWFAQAAGIDSDKDYTTGISLSYTSGPIASPGWVGRITDLPSFFGSQGDSALYRWGLSINQNIYTPEDTDLEVPPDDDRPYAAWLYLGASLQVEHREGGEPIRLDTFEFTGGVVGPWALGEELQNNFHNLINDDESQGWDYQLKNEPALNLFFERRWRTDAWEPARGIGFEFDALPYVGAGLGNVMTYGAAGGIVRVGQNLRADFGPPRIRPGLPGSEDFVNEGFSWYLFAGLEGQAVGYNIFLDGNTFRDSDGVDRRVFTGSGQFGAAVFFNGVRLAYTHVVQSPEFHERDRILTYGSVSLSFSF